MSNADPTSIGPPPSPSWGHGRISIHSSGRASPSSQRHISSHSSERQPRPVATPPQRRVHRSPTTGTSTRYLSQEEEDRRAFLATQAKVPRAPISTPPTSHRREYHTTMNRTPTGVGSYSTARSVSPSGMRSPSHHHRSTSLGSSAASRALPGYQYPPHLASKLWSENTTARTSEFPSSDSSSKPPRERHLDRKRNGSLSLTSQHQSTGSFHLPSSGGRIRRSGSMSSVSDTKQAAGIIPRVERHTGDHISTGQHLGFEYPSGTAGSKKSDTATSDSRASGQHSSRRMHTYSSGSVASKLQDRSSPDPPAKAALVTQTRQCEDTSLKLGAGSSSLQRREESVAKPGSGTDLHKVKKGERKDIEIVGAEFGRSKEREGDRVGIRRGRRERERGVRGEMVAR